MYSKPDLILFLIPLFLYLELCNVATRHLDRAGKIVVVLII